MRAAPPLTLPLLLAAVSVQTACRPKSAPTTRLAAAPTSAPAATQPLPSPRPLLDIRRGTGSFPLSDQPVDSPTSLAAALRDGYLARLTPADQNSLVTLTGTLPSLDLLRVDVSDARVRADYRPADFAKDTQTDQSITARRLEYVADPLRYDAASVHATLTADDATLHVIRDDQGSRGLVLAGARSGRMTFRTSPADLTRILSLAPRRASGDAAKYTVLRSDLSFASDHPRTLAAKLDLRARYLLFPFAISLRGRLDAAPDGTLTFSDLDANGHDPGGLLVAPLLNRALQKLNGTSRAILSFPDPQTRVTGVRFDTSTGLSLTITFGQK